MPICTVDRILSGSQETSEWSIDSSDPQRLATPPQAGVRGQGGNGLGDIERRGCGWQVEGWADWSPD